MVSEARRERARLLDRPTGPRVCWAEARRRAAGVLASPLSKEESGPLVSWAAGPTGKQVSYYFFIFLSFLCLLVFKKYLK
jgi:hypothetical protein